MRPTTTNSLPASSVLISSPSVLARRKRTSSELRRICQDVGAYARPTGSKPAHCQKRKRPEPFVPAFFIHECLILNREFGSYKEASNAYS